MDYKEKRKYWEQLHSTKTLNKDIELLKKHNPNSRALESVKRLKNKAPGRLEKEILWALLDVCSPDKIKNNRKVRPSSTKKNTRTKKTTTKKTGNSKKTIKKPAVNKVEAKTTPTPESKEEGKKKSNERSGVSGDKLGQS